MNDPAALTYPVFWVEAKRRRGFSTFAKVKHQIGFTTFSRLPAKMQFSTGYCFDSAGLVFRYDGSAGWPRFDGRLKTLIEFFILPAVVSKSVEYFVYFGPALTSSHSVDLLSFKKSLFEAINSHGHSDSQALMSMISKAKSYEDAISAAENWQCFSGSRDQDGHSKYLDDGSRNPDFSLDE